MATYYVAEGGTATDQAKENATSGTYPGGCLSPAGHNAETFAAGDSILFSDEGGVIRATITPPTSGTSGVGEEITYGVKSGDTPEIRGSDLVTGFENAGGGSTNDTATIDADADDAYWYNSTYYTDAWASLGSATNGSIQAGFVFNGLAVPQGATITTAKITFTAHATISTTTVNLRIQAENQASTDSFDNSSDFTTRLADLTTAYVDWDNVGTWTATNAYDSPEIKTVVQEVVDLVGWSSGNNITIFVNDNSGTGNAYRQCKARGGDNTSGLAVLSVTYESDGGLWEVTSYTTEPEQVFFDGNFGDRKASAEACVNEYDWFWGSDTLTVYAASDPDTLYTDPGVEAGQRDSCFDMEGIDHLTIDGVIFSHSNKGGIDNIDSNPDSSDSITIQNCTSEWNWLYGVKVDGITAYTDWTIQDNVFRHNGSCGVQVRRTSSDGLIRRNTAYENGKYQNDGETGGEYDLDFSAGLKLLGWRGSPHTLQDWVVEHNLVYNNGPTTPASDSGNGTGLWADECGATSGHPNIFRHNLVYGNKAPGMYIEKSDYTEVYGNVFYDNAATDSSWTIRLLAYDNLPASYNKIYNNTVVDGGFGNLGVNSQADGDAQVNYNLIKNNIFVGAPDHASSYTMCGFQNGGANDTTNGTGNEVKYNCFGAERGTKYIYWGASHYYTIDSFETAAGAAASGNLGSDPSFTAAGTDDYTLASDSPCIGAGANLGADYDDALMPSSTWPDGVVTGDQDDY